MKLIRVWWRPVTALAGLWLLQNGFSAFFQGATSELGQTLYSYVSKLGGFLEAIQLLDWLQS